MIDTAYLSTLPSLSGIVRNPRQWSFFCWLLSKAREDGYAEVSVCDYAKTHGLNESTVRSWLISRNFRGIIESISHNSRTIVFFCEFDSYATIPTENTLEFRGKFAESSRNFRGSGRKLADI